MCATVFECLSAIKDISLATAAVITARVAILGLGNWNRELHGRANFEVARSLAKSLYTLRESIRSCRYPLISSCEFPDNSESDTQVQSAESKTQDYLHVYTERWKPVSAALRDFDVQSLEAEAIWGSAIRGKIETLRKCVGQLYNAIDDLVHNYRSEGRAFKDDPEFAKRTRAIVSDSQHDSSNEYGQQLANAIQGVEDELREHLRRK